jgi:hypothetical protein
MMRIKLKYGENIKENVKKYIIYFDELCVPGAFKFDRLYIFLIRKN